MSVDQPNPDPDDALTRAENVAAELAERCRELCDISGWAAETGLERAVNTLMTELWDQGFSQREIRAAYSAALDDMNRYAAGEDRRS